jgi:hypothetical protein
VANRAAGLMKTETNRTAYNRLSRQLLRCPYCKPNRNENAGRRPTHKSKPRKKNHRHP